jgi:glycosyltransferase involved in cell wall biosynthesis
MKVLILGGYSPEKPVGGVQTHIDRLAYHLSQIKDCEIHLITFGDEKKEIINGNLRIHVLKKWLPGYFNLPLEFLILIHEIWRVDPDIVHAHESCMPYSTAAAIMCKKYPTLLTMHMVLQEWPRPVSNFGKISRWITLQNEKYVLSKIPNIIAVSSYLKDKINELSKSKLFIVPNGTDIEKKNSNIEYENHLLDKNVIFSVGMLDERKGIDILIRSILLVKTEIPDVLLFIAGQGDNEFYLKKLTKELKLEEKVKFLGYISEKEKRLYFSFADIFVLPSRHEPFGIVLLEAMSYGKPILASNVGGIPDIIKDGKNGLFFESTNFEDLAQKIIMLFTDDKLKDKLSTNGKSMIKIFAWENVATKTFDIYEEIKK